MHPHHKDFVGVLFSPNRTRSYQGIPYAIDNGAYGAFLKGEEFDSELFLNVCKQFAQKERPLFVVCPDKVNDKPKTLRLWDVWQPILAKMRLPVAFVYTNGMELSDIPVSADYVFIGGDNEFKEKAIAEIPLIKQPVHVGRVNHHSRLWKSHNWGAASCDGTGWFRGDKRQEQVLYDYLDIKSEKQPQEKNALFHIGAFCR